MDEYLKTLDSLAEQNASLISEQREIIAAAEKAINLLIVKGQKIQQARALHAELGFSEAVVIEPEKAPKTLKRMILDLLDSAASLTKDETVKRLYAMGVKANSTTVGSTLSKMAASGEIEKEGHKAYRKKGEVPVGAGTSSATKSVEDENK